MKKISTFTAILIAVFTLTANMSHAVYVPSHETVLACPVAHEPVRGLLKNSTGFTQVTLHKGVLIPHVNLSAVDIVATGVSARAYIPHFELSVVEIIANKNKVNYLSTCKYNGERIAHVQLSAVEIIPMNNSSEWTANEEENSDGEAGIFSGFNIEIPKLSFSILRRLFFL